MVEVRMFGTLREISGVRSIKVDAETVWDALRKVSTKFGDKFEKELFPKGKLTDSYAVLLNGRNVMLGKGLNMKVRSGDVIAIIPPVGGGKV